MRVLILGAGISGMAATRLARRQQHAVTVYDEGHLDPSIFLAMGVGVVTGGWDTVLLQGIDVVVASPGFSERSLPVMETLEAGVPIWSEIEFAWRAMAQRPLIAVTGTNGKTTTTSAAADMLRRSGIEAVAAGNIGIALSGVVDDVWDVAVVEVSSFQLRFVERFHARTAAIVNVASDHLDWHGSVQGYAAAKARIFERQGPTDLLVYNADDPGAETLARRASSTTHPVSVLSRPHGGSGVSEGVLHLPGTTIALEEIGSADPAHVVDLAVAGVLALHTGAEPEAVQEVMSQFRAGAHRRVQVASVGGVAYVDDSKATNLHAALAAVAAYGPVVLIAGGLAKGLDLTPLASVDNVVGLVGIGTAGPGLAEAAGERGRTAETMQEAVLLATEMAEPGDTVLLAPGGASFDQFESYAHRGEAFESAVNRLTEETA